jgi:hypothetical protein
MKNCFEDEEEILEYIFEIVENPILKCKSKIEYIEEVLEEYFGEDEEYPDEEDNYNRFTKTRFGRRLHTGLERVS